jgi:hypothetical protein
VLKWSSRQCANTSGNGTKRKCQPVRVMSAFGGKPAVAKADCRFRF